MSKKPSRSYTEEESIYYEIEPKFIYDYLDFANNLRVIEASTINHETYSMEQNGKRMHLIILKEIFLKSLEDLGAVLLALYRRYNKDPDCEYQKAFNNPTPISYTIINYKIGTAYINNTLLKFQSQNEFIEKLHISDLNESFKTIKITRNDEDLDLDRESYFKFMYDLIKLFGDDQYRGSKVYNKIKHGAVILGSAKILNPQNEDVPAVIYVDHDKGFSDHPLITEQLVFTKEEFESLQNGPLAVSNYIRRLLVIYMSKNYPDYLISQGFKNPAYFLKQPNPPEDPSTRP